MTSDPLVQDKLKKKERKANFLNMELQDIKNNKGSLTLQIKSIEHLQTWLKKSHKLQSDMLIQPLDLPAERIRMAFEGGNELEVKEKPNGHVPEPEVPVSALVEIAPA